MDAVADLTRNGEQVAAEAFDIETWVGLLRVCYGEARPRLVTSAPAALASRTQPRQNPGCTSTAVCA